MRWGRRRVYHLLAAAVLLLTVGASVVLWVLTWRIADAAPISALSRQRDLSALLFDVQALRHALHHLEDYGDHGDPAARAQVDLAATVTALRLRDNQDLYAAIDPPAIGETQRDLGLALRALQPDTAAARPDPAALAAHGDALDALIPRLRRHNDDIHQEAMAQASAQGRLLVATRWSLLAFQGLFGAFGLLLIALLLRQHRAMADLERRDRHISAVEAAQAELRERVVKIANNAPGAIFQARLHADGRLELPFISDAITALCGCEAAAAMADPAVLLAVVHPEDAPRLRLGFQASARTLAPWTDQFRLRHPERGTLWVEGHATPEAGLGPGAVTWHGHLIEVTARMQAEMDLRASEERFRLTLDAVRDGTWDWDVESGSVTFDARALEMLGEAPASATLTQAAWVERLHPDDRARVMASLKVCLDSDEAFTLDFRLRRADGSHAWIASRGQVVARRDGRPVRVLGTHTDISDRRAMEEALRRSNADLEQFAYGVSHDLRQPLRMIHSYLQLLERALKDKLDERSREFLAFALDGSRRMEQMMVGLLDYSRVSRTTEPIATIESRPTVDEALRYLAPAIDEAAARITVDGDWPRLPASRDELVRLFQNLISNALKYHRPGQPPRIAISARVDGDRWEVAVSDDGLGLPADHAGRLFQVFQRLHGRASADGAGIGLALCRRIVEHHGGAITAHSPGENQGSTFTVRLPLHREGAE